MEWTLEVVIVPVTNVDRAKAFYANQLGFNLDFDTVISPESRVAQLTPHGSGCSIQVGIGITDMVPGSLKGVQLVVPDLVAAHKELVGRGVEVSAIQVYGNEGLRPYRDGDALDNVGFVFFNDPDGNSWCIQQISASLASRQAS
jgi:catechol 2,3-dioxygenase-like lactoylglutathione lyase family enzyme